MTQPVHWLNNRLQVINIYIYIYHTVYLEKHVCDIHMTTKLCQPHTEQIIISDI